MLLVWGLLRLVKHRSVSHTPSFSRPARLARFARFARMSTGGHIDRASDKRYDCFISFPGSQNLSDLGFKGPSLDCTVRALVKKVDERLRRFPRQPSVFFDHREMEGHWKDYLAKAILQLRGGGVALVLLTAKYLRRKYCLAELRAFLDLERMTTVPGRASEAVHIIVVNLEQEKHAVRNALRYDAIKDFIGDKLGRIQWTPLSVETRGNSAQVVNEICRRVEKYWHDRPHICLGREPADCLDYLADVFSASRCETISRKLGLLPADLREGMTVLSIFHKALEKRRFADQHYLSKLSEAAPDDLAREALAAFGRKWISDTWEWSIARGKNDICLESFTSKAQLVIATMPSAFGGIGSTDVDVARRRAFTPIASSFSNPVTKGIELVRPADALGTNRSVKLAISNNTDKALILLGSHMDCGEISIVPQNIQPRESASGLVKSYIGAYGVKGALIYQWCGSNYDKDRVCVYFENPFLGKNKSGIKYYWDTRESWHWYYCNVPTMEGQKEMKNTINGWLTIKSFVSNGMHAGGAFVVETQVI